MQEDSLRRLACLLLALLISASDGHARMLTMARSQTFAFQTGLTMHDRYHGVSTEIFASMCHPRFSEFDRCMIQLMLTMIYPMQ